MPRPHQNGPYGLLPILNILTKALRVAVSMVAKGQYGGQGVYWGMSTASAVFLISDTLKYL